MVAADALALSFCLLPLGPRTGRAVPHRHRDSARRLQHMGIATAAPIMLRSPRRAAGVALLASLLTRLMKQDLVALGTRASPDALTAAMGHGLQSVFGCAAGVALLAACSSVCWLRLARSSGTPVTDALTWPRAADTAR